MTKPKFSIVVISKNEANTISKLTASLKEFQDRGGEMLLTDTGSTDGTVELARSLGWKVTEVGEKFITTIDKELVEQINNRFIVDGEEPIVKEGSRLFDFAAARNYALSLASNNMICSLDADEAYTKFDIDELNRLIDEGWEQFEYQFVYQHDQWGGAAIQFVQCKFFDRRKIQWTNIVHEVVEGNAKRMLLPESVIKLEHWQEAGKESRGGYLPGLAYDCYFNQEKDRQSHYLARELMWTDRPRSAIKEFLRHIEMNKWPTEKAQSCIFVGDCFGMLNQPQEQLEWYNLGFYNDSNRREALIKIAAFYLHNKNYKACLAFTKASLEIPWTDYYANDKSHYEDYPHFLLYTAYGWDGQIEEAKFHLNRALELKPLNSTYLRDIGIFQKLPTVSFIIPHIKDSRNEGLERCIKSIKNLNYPQDRIDIKIIEGEGTVPEKVKQGVEETNGEYIVYAADDMEFTSDALILNILDTVATKKRLTVFDTVEVDKNGVGIRNEQGFTCEHFLIKRDLVDFIGEIFDIDFKHYCVDDLLWNKCEKINEAQIGRGRFIHYHPSRIGSGIQKDWINEKAISSLNSDREILKQKLDYPTVYHKIDIRNKLPKDISNLKVLNVGIGDMKSGLACQLPFLKFAELTMIDVHQPYIDYAKRGIWKTPIMKFENKDIRNVNNWNDYDLIMIFDVLEHLEKEQSIGIINKIKKPLLVFGPLEKEFRHNHFGVESQDHLSLWTEQDFMDLGFNTTLLKDFHEEEGERFDALWAIK